MACHFAEAVQVVDAVAVADEPLPDHSPGLSAPGSRRIPPGA